MAHRCDRKLSGEKRSRTLDNLVFRHQDVGRGTYILVEPGGQAQSMPSGTTRALLGALRAIEAGGQSGMAAATAPERARPHHHEGGGV